MAFASSPVCLEQDAATPWGRQRRSWRLDGAHFVGVESPDTRLLSLAAWRDRSGLDSGRASDLFPSSAALPRLTHAGRRVSLATILAQDALREAHGRHRTRPRYGRGLGQAETLDVDWQATDAEVLDDLSASVHGDTFGYYDPLMTVTQDQALCILGGTHVMILGDSISRYFTYQFNNFLINGDVAAEFGDEGDGCLKWGCATEISGVYSGPYFDSGKKWSPGTERSDSSGHRQIIEATIDGGAYGDVTTTFRFTQDTWYDDLEDEASEINEGDVLIVNSGWWELKEDDEEDHASDGCSFSDSDDVSDFYRDSDCLDSYETDLENLVAGILRYFVNDDDKAVVWRMTTCCGVDDSDLGNQRIGAIAVGAMNTIADKVMADNGIDTANVYQLSNIANLGTGAGDGTGRTFDGFHPRAREFQIWTQILLNKIARQLGNTEECLAAPSPAPTPRPVTPPTPAPTTSAPSLIPCL